MKKRKERKILSLFLAIVLSLSMTVTSFAAGSTDGTESTDTEVLELLGDQASETEWTAEDFVYTEMSQTMNGCDLSEDDCYQRTGSGRILRVRCGENSDEQEPCNSVENTGMVRPLSELRTEHLKNRESNR